MYGKRTVGHPQSNSKNLYADKNVDEQYIGTTTSGYPVFVWKPPFFGLIITIQTINQVNKIKNGYVMKF